MVVTEGGLWTLEYDGQLKHSPGLDLGPYRLLTLWYARAMARCMLAFVTTCCAWKTMGES